MSHWKFALLLAALSLGAGERVDWAGIGAVRGLDMDEVRGKAARQQAERAGR